jgi:uncharacterized protein (TIGR00369 family)
MSAETPEATLQRWRDEEAAVRARLGQAGVARLDQIAGKSGLEVFDAIFAGELPYPHIGETLDFLPVRVERGHSIFQGRPGRAHYNPLGVVHGGWFATLLDSCVGCAVHSALPAGKTYTTVELKVNMVRALTDKVPLVRAEGRIIHIGRSMGTADGRLVGHDGTLYAHASTTCFIFDLPAEKPPR